LCGKWLNKKLRWLSFIKGQPFFMNVCLYIVLEKVQVPGVVIEKSKKETRLFKAGFNFLTNFSKRNGT
jgi:hypothetical protein